jgi:TolB-like protein
MKLFSELKRRNVFRVAVAYLVAIWLVIQVTGEVAPALGLPAWTSSMVVWLSIVGFPFMLIFAWMYELTPEGLRREEGDSETDDAGIPYSTPGLNMLITALLAVALVFVIVDSYVMTDDASGDPASQQAEPALPGPAIDANSIAVLPFTNMSEDDAQDYFSDGLAEELLNLLAQQRGLKVAARTSSFSFRNAQQDIRAIGDALDVATVLEGSVRKAGNRLRITAQLIDVSDGYHLWSETYDRELTDVFQVQDEIAAAIVQALSLHLDMPASVQQAPGNIEAYDLYLQGRHLSRRAEQASAEEALALYRRATEVDPSFAPAWAALGNEALALRESQFWDGIPEADAIAIAQDSIDRALALSPDLAEAHVTQSFLHWDRYRFEQALESSERAIAINPNLATAHAARARVLEAMGYIGDAWDALGKGIQLDPLDHDQMVKRVRLARGYLDDEHLERAKRAYVDALARQGAEGFKEESSYIDLMGGIRRSDEFARWYRKAYEMGAELEAERFIAILRLWRFDSPFIEKMRSPDAYRMYLTSWRNRPQRALQMYEELPEEIQAVPIVLEERSIAQMNAGDCPGALDSLYSAHGDTVRIYGQVVPAMMRSNSNLALNRAWCLRLTGKEDEAAALLERVDTYLARLRDSAIYSYFNVDAKFRLMHGDTGGALDSLEAAMVRNEVDFSLFADPVLRSLTGNPRFERLRSDLEAHVNAEREKLGWPAASL